MRTPRELADVLMALRQRAVPRGPRVAVLTDGGGHGVDRRRRARGPGLDVRRPSTTRRRPALTAEVGAQSSVANPVDLAGYGEVDPQSYARVFAALQDADDVDAVLVTGYFGGYSSGDDGLDGLGPAETAAAKQIAADAVGRKPVAVQSIFPDSAGVPGARRGRRTGVRGRSRTPSPCWRPPPPRRARATVEPLPAAAVPLAVAGYTAARAAFAAAGVAFVPAREVRTARRAGGGRRRPAPRRTC